MTLKQIDPKETYIVREIFCCGEGHCPGITFTHWETGEACTMDHSSNATNKDVHLYWRKVLIPLYRGTDEDRYSSDSEDMWNFLNLPKNINKWCHFIIASKEMKVGDRVEPTA
jgi:hypothetical protein